MKTVQDLENEKAHVNKLRALLPICCMCKNIRDDEGYWGSVENYFTANADIDFSHCYCPNCEEKTLAAIEKSQCASPVGQRNSR